jgi:hypothetical protein
MCQPSQQVSGDRRTRVSQGSGRGGGNLGFQGRNLGVEAVTRKRLCRA